MGVTKAVSDRFGNGGIADRMIWSNGFPFLDNKEDHVFNVPVSHAMTADPAALPASGFPIREAERLLGDNKFQGFPIAEVRTNKILVGYIGRTELRYAIDRARNESILAPNAQCVFTKEAAEATVARRASVSSRNIDTFDGIQSNVGANHVDFSRYVDHTPLTVHPRLPLETVMEIFKKMGPRVILVEHRGRLMGLVTVKDCLKYQFKVEAEEQALAATNGPDMYGDNSLGNGNGNGRNPEAPSLEDKVWSFMQRIRGKLPWWQATPATATARARPSADGFEPQETSRILEGTEDDEGLVELEERL